MKRPYSVAIAALLLLLSVTGTACSIFQHPTTAPGGFFPASDFSLTTLQGDTYTLSQLRGKIVILNFWGIWATSSILQLTDLETIWDKYGSRGVVVIGVEINNTEAEVRETLSKNITFPIAVDADHKLEKGYKVTGVPETFIIDAQGNIAHQIYSSMSVADFSTLLDTLLGKP